MGARMKHFVDRFRIESHVQQCVYRGWNRHDNCGCAVEAAQDLAYRAWIDEMCARIRLVVFRGVPP